jgi:hypothetical protein
MLFSPPSFATHRLRSSHRWIVASSSAIAVGVATFACGSEGSSGDPDAATPTEDAGGSDGSRDPDRQADGAIADAGPDTGPPASTGDVLFARAFGSPGLSQVEAVAFDANDNVFVAGEFTGVATDFGCPTKLDSTVPGGGVTFNPHSLFVAKYAPNGDCIWAANIGRSSGDRLQGLAIDAAGEAWVALYVTAVPNDYKSVIVRLASATGIEKWSRTLGGPVGTSVEVGPVAVLGDGSVVVTGSIRAKNAGTVDFGDGKTVALTAGGDDHRPFMLGMMAGPTAATAKDLLVFPAANKTYVFAATRHASSGDVVLGGLYFEKIAYPTTQGGVETATVTTSAPWMARVRPSGVVFHKELTIPNQKVNYGGTASAPDGTILIAASYTGSSVSLEGESLPNGGLGNLAVMKLDAQGQKRWVKGFASDGSEGANAVAVDSWGNVLVVGPHTTGGLDFGTGALPSTTHLTSYVAKLDEKGKTIYAHHLGAEGELGVFTVATAPASGRVAIGGYYKGTATFAGGKTLPAPPDGGVARSGAGFVVVTQP